MRGNVAMERLSMFDKLVTEISGIIGYIQNNSDKDLPKKITAEFLENFKKLKAQLEHFKDLSDIEIKKLTALKAGDSSVSAKISEKTNTTIERLRKLKKGLKKTLLYLPEQDESLSGKKAEKEKRKPKKRENTFKSIGGTDSKWIPL